MISDSTGSSSSGNQTPDSEGADFQRRFTMFLQYRDHLWKIRQSNYEKVDTIILTISSALLGWSPTLLVKPAADGLNVSYNWFLSAWGCLALAIFSTLSSFLFVRRAINEQIEGAEEYYLKCDESAFDRGKRWTFWTEVLNVSSSGVFILGLLLLAVAVLESRR